MIGMGEPFPRRPGAFRERGPDLDLGADGPRAAHFDGTRLPHVCLRVGGRPGAPSHPRRPDHGYPRRRLSERACPRLLARLCPARLGVHAPASGSWWDRGTNRPELATSYLLDRLHPVLRREHDPRLPPAVLGRLFDTPNPLDLAISAKLAEPLSLNFSTETPLGDIKKYIEAATQDPALGLPTGIPIYLDVANSREANNFLRSTVSINVQDVPLRTALGLILKQLGLAYDVRDGLPTITKGASGTELDDFRLVGYCYLALVMALIGGCVGLYFWKTQHGWNARRGSYEVATSAL